MATEYKVKLSGDSTGLVRATQQGQGALKRLSAELTGMQALASKALNFAGVGGLSVAAVGGSFVAMARNVAGTAKQIKILSEVSNTSAEDFQRLAYGAKSVGIEQDKLADIFKDTQDKVGDFLETGAGPLADFFENIAPRVGVTAEQFRNLSGPQALQLYVSSLEKANLSQSEMTFYMEAIASDSARLLPLLRENGKGFREAGEEAAKLGAIMGEDLVQKGIELEKSFEKLQTYSKGFGIAIASEVIPALNNLAGEFANARTAGLSFMEALVGVGLSNPGKSPAEQIAALANEVERLQRGNLGEVNLLEKLAPEESIRIAQGKLKYFQLELQRDASTSQAALANLGGELATIQGNIAKLEQVQADRGGYLNNFDKASLARFKQEAAALQTRIAELQKIVDQYAKVDTGSNPEVVALEKEKQAAIQRLLLGTTAARRQAAQDEITAAKATKRALEEAWKAATEGAKAAAAEAKNLMQQAAEARQSGTDRAADRRMRGATDEEKDSFARRQVRDLSDQARRSTVFAQNAGFDGNLTRAAQLAAEAAKYAERAEKFADQITDDGDAANAIEKIAELKAQALETAAKVEATVSEQKTDEAGRIASQIKYATDLVDSLQAKAKGLQLVIDPTQAKAELDWLQAKLDAIKDKTVTVTVATVDAAAPNPGTPADVLPARAYGGPLPGRATSDRADNVIYRGTPGEWVIQRPAVRHWGEGFLRAINEMRLPAFADGGRIPGQSLINNIGPGFIASSHADSAAAHTPITLQWPDGTSAQVTAKESVAKEIVSTFRRAALARGGRR
ncbi:MAG: hypothetical protein Q7J47_03355 [Azoarcus sp.]|nr:hypothetical protein [Azoarcus sp.]